MSAGEDVVGARTRDDPPERAAEHLEPQALRRELLRAAYSATRSEADRDTFPVVAADTPRYLGRTHGYVDFASIAADPLEAVSAETQEELTRRAHVTWAKERQRRWGSTMRTINTAIADFAAGGVDRRVAGDLRQIRRGTDRVSRRLEEELRQADGG